MDTEALKEHYETHGYCLVPGEISTDIIVRLQNEIAAGVDAHARSLYAAGQITELHSDQPFDRRLVQLYRGRKMGLRQWDEAVAPGTLNELARTHRLLDALTLLLGPNILFSGDFHLRPKLPDDALTSFPWHQDSQYYGAPTAPLHIVTAWVPLVDVTTENGCLWVIPGSHRWGLLAGKRGDDMNVRTFEDVEKRGTAIPVPMKRGDVLLFTNLTFHASKLNLTPTVRWSLDLRYIATPDYTRLKVDQLEALAYYSGKLQAYGRQPVAVRGDYTTEPALSR
jgi:phytanoyl-CoA hydroxylase